MRDAAALRQRGGAALGFSLNILDHARSKYQQASNNLPALYHRGVNQNELPYIGWEYPKPGGD
jgi:hypothetical protein